MLKEITKGIMIAGAAALLFTAGGCGNDDPEPSRSDKNQIVKCEGVNDCAGKGACAGAGHDCAGKNACKGKGYVEIKRGDCESQGGKEV